MTRYATAEETTECTNCHTVAAQRELIDGSKCPNCRQYAQLSQFYLALMHGEGNHEV